MTTIKISIYANELARAEKRLATLTRINAPAQIITSAQGFVDDLKSDNYKVGHMDEFGPIEYSQAETKVGRMGKQYVQFATETGPVNYYPFGRFGPFLARAR